MTDTATQTRSVVVEREIPHPPEKIWRALTQPHLMEAWLMKNDFQPVVGHRFTLRGEWGGVLDCEVLVVEPYRTLAYTWNHAHDDPAFSLTSVVTFTLTPTAAGSLLRMEQSGFRPDQRQAFGGAHAGWREFLAKLEQVLERGGLSRPRRTAPAQAAKDAGKPILLSGGNPQIPKGYGDAPVQAYIAAMPGWKRQVGQRLDALVERTVPGVSKAVKWNSPFYGVEGQGWFLSFHCFTRYVKVTFFRGSALDPPPPGPSKHKDVRYLDIHEDEPLDEAQLADWVKQASRLPGERM